MKATKWLDFDLRRISHWFKWACWLALIALVVCERFCDKLPWDAWQSRMLYPGLALAFLSLLFSFFNIELNRVPWTLIALVPLGWQFVSVGETTDVDALRKATVMPWVYIVGFALLHDQARRRGQRQQSGDSGGNPPGVKG